MVLYTETKDKHLKCELFGRQARPALHSKSWIYNNTVSTVMFLHQAMPHITADHIAENQDDTLCPELEQHSML